MSWLWADLVPQAPAGVVAAVPVADAGAGRSSGVLAFWPQDRERRPRRALRVDARVLAAATPAPRGHGGPAAWISWCHMDAGHSLAFDDGAVSGAIRRCLAQPWPGAVSTMLVDWSRIAGALTIGRSPAAVADDPFAGVFPHRRVLRAPASALGTFPAPTGPCITRYGSGNPWPWDRYVGQEP